jgi:hypothetical protein
LHAALLNLPMSAAIALTPTARNLAFIAALMDSGVEFVATDNPHANKLTIHILAAVAQHEREAISERTKAALAAAKARGVKLGGPNLEDDRQDVGGEPIGGRDTRFGAHVQFENVRHHDHGLRAITIFEHCELKCLGTVDKKASAKTASILDDPVAAAVLADPEKRGFRTVRRRTFTFVHGTFPFEWIMG